MLHNTMDSSISSVENLNVDSSIKEKLKLLIDEEIFSLSDIMYHIIPSIESLEAKPACNLISRFIKKVAEANPEDAENPLHLWEEVLREPCDLMEDVTLDDLSIPIPLLSTSTSSSLLPLSKCNDEKARKERAAERRRNGRHGLDERVKKLADELGWEFVISKLQRRLGPKKRKTSSTMEDIDTSNDNIIHLNEDIVDEAGMNEIFLGRISVEVFEDEIYDLMSEKIGPEAIIHIRVMTNNDGLSRGFAFVRLQDKETCFKAVRALNNFEIRPRYQMKVNYSPPNVRLHVSNIPKSKNKEQLKIEFENVTEGLKDLHVHQGVEENRGFCFIDYMTHQCAKASLRKLNQPGVKIFGRNVTADWAEPFKEVDPEIMEKVRTLYVKNLAPDVSEEELKKIFSEVGEVEFVRRNVDYAFVHYVKRSDALQALEQLNNTVIGKNAIALDLARPPDAVRRDGGGGGSRKGGGGGGGGRRRSSPSRNSSRRSSNNNHGDYGGRSSKFNGSYPSVPVVAFPFDSYDYDGGFKRDFAKPDPRYGTPRSYRDDFSLGVNRTAIYDPRAYEAYAANPYVGSASRDKRMSRPDYGAYKDMEDMYTAHASVPSPYNRSSHTATAEVRHPMREDAYDYGGVKQRASENYYEDTDSSWYGGGQMYADVNVAQVPSPTATRGGGAGGNGGGYSRGVKRHGDVPSASTYSPAVTSSGGSGGGGRGMKRFRGGGGERGRPSQTGW